MDYKDVIEKVFNDDFDKVNSYRYQDIINYLNTVNDSFTLETYFISMDDVLNKLNNNDYFVDLNMYASNNILKCPFPFEKVIKLIRDNLNKNITKLNIPEAIIENDISWLKEFKNLSELTISSINFLNKENLDYIVNNTSIKKLIFEDYSISIPEIDGLILIDNGEKNIGYYNGLELENTITKTNKNSVSVTTNTFDFKYMDSVLKSKSDNINLIEINGNKEEFKIMFDGKDVTIEVSSKNMDISKDFVMFFKNKGYNVKEVIINMELPGKNILDKEKIKYLDYDYEELDKLSKEVDLSVKFSVIDISSYEDYRGLVESMKYYKEVITDYDLSPVERLTFAYDLVKSFSYKESPNEKNESRNPYKIIRSGYIVCAGYTAMLEEIMSNIDDKVSVSDFGVTCYNDDGTYEHHSRAMARIDDDKYNIHGFYIMDPTWDSYKKNGKDVLKEDYNALDLYRYFLVPISEYNRVFPNDSSVGVFDFKYRNLNNELVNNEFFNKEHNDFEFSQEITKIYGKDTSKEEILKSINSPKIEFNTLMEIIKNTRLAEGYNNEQVKEEMEKIKRIYARFYPEIDSVNESIKR